MNVNPEPSTSRIAPVDGLRALAVLGVIWAHVWAFTGTPKLSLGHWGSFSLDLQRLISMFGTGVDLFFVISGFCMYLMYIRKQTEWSWNAYGLFMKRRWLRLAPAFYTACVVYVIGIRLAGLPFYGKSFLANIAFVQILFPKLKALASPFWSLATEWHFYMVLPLLLWSCLRWGFQRVMGMAFLLCMVLRTWIYVQPDPVIRLWTTQFPPRFIEFGWGILVAHAMVAKRIPPRMLQGNSGFLIGLAVMFAGRLLLTKEVAGISGRWSALPMIVWEPLLTLGYALMLWNVVSSASIFSELLSGRPVQAIGRWSYSLYIWHWWPVYVLAPAMKARLGPTLLAQYLTLAMVLALVLPVGWLSYEWLEAPYFRRWREKAQST